MDFDLDIYEALQEMQMLDLMLEPPEELAEETGISNLTAESIIDNGDDRRMKTLTNFTCARFTALYEIIDTPLRSAHYGGHPTKFSAMTMFFMTLHWRKFGLPWVLMAEWFQISETQVSRIVYSSRVASLQPLWQSQVRWASMTDVEKGVRFEEIPDAIGAVDAAFQRMLPAHDRVSYYDGKHKTHTIKVQAFVTPDGLLRHFSGPYPGRVHDFCVLQQSNLIQMWQVEKMQRGQVPVQVLADKGYTGPRSLH